MKILSLLSKLIDYPTEELVSHKDYVLELIEADTVLDDDDKSRLTAFVNERCEMDLLDWQSDYDALFERGRSVSLLLFEHIHGESRDRGQAMINLLNEYKAAGLHIGVRELPDYIPLFLEFLSTQGEENAQGWLQDVAHILALLKVRLAQRGSDYTVLFDALVNLTGLEIDYADLAEQVKGEKRDDTKEALDKVWEEEMVKFGSDIENSCPTSQNRPSESQRRDQDVPIQFVNAANMGVEDVTQHMGGQ